MILIGRSQFTPLPQEESLSALVNLERLEMDNCRVRSLDPDALLSFGRLRHLDLTHNDLTALPPGLLHPIVHRHLEESRLGFNRIAELDSDAFVGLPRLEALDLSG
jgi:Leucine-rich repeat (LRR) protein